MNALLDTHTFLWWVADAPQLSEPVKNFISDPNNQIFFSVASAWEIIIKVGTGKLTIPESPNKYLNSRVIDNRFEILQIELPHVLQVANLPDLHRDPFDRIIIAQSQVTKMPILTIDRLVIQYAVDVIW
ncbi:type II toxin-antitoxin system VapC family toxin [Chamaesiphon sp. OTE_75_metabat_556]|uniref:type II toxin-antitoxin system VapC family toxin n=1 Tax=Chamaesiphon sp. OTE_75_metabat_556 TaxID=2964692 RepID=UPI00286BA787|nr:type II toxin-antitoxin system VapC family toxin [Chamaesiphon sp. OTE_75_metabat_556]